MNDALWTGLLDDFKALRDMQKGDELRGVLIEFSTPEALGRGGKIIHNKHYPEEWAKTRSIISEPIIDKREESKRVYRLMVVPYRGNEQLQGDNQTPDLNQEYQVIKSRLEELLSLAGKELLSLDSVSNRLPLEVTSLSNPVLSWLIFLFYLGKPDRYTWERVNQCIAFGVAMGAISRGEIKEMAPNFGPPNTDLPLDVGQFSFEPLAENSYSVIKNITAASIEAIYRIKGGLFSTDQEETEETEQVQHAGDLPDGSPESSVNSINNPKKNLPDTADIRDLCHYLEKHYGKKPTAQLVRDFLRCTIKDRRWKSFETQAGRFKHLWHPDHKK